MTGLKILRGFVLIFSILFLSNIYFSETSANIYSKDLLSGILSKWYWTNPLPSGNTLNSVHFTDAETGIGAGDFGNIMKTTDGGKSWKLCSSNTASDISEIFFINKNTGYASGKSGTIIKTTDGGNIWYNSPTLTANNLNSIFFSSTYTGYCAGLNSTVLKTTNEGASWVRLNIKNNASLFCINFLNDNTGVAAGYNIILKTTDGGNIWSEQDISFNPSCKVTGINYINENTIYAAADAPAGKFFKTTNSGLNWYSFSLNLPYLFGGSVDLIRSMVFENADNGFIVTDFGTILKTTNAGNNWKADTSLRPSYEKLSVMKDVNISEDGIICISGGGGSVYTSTNSGNKWIVKNGNENSLRVCKFINSKTGFAAGENGELLKTSDGGKYWKHINSFSKKFLNTVFFLNEKNGYVAGDSGTILRTINGGNNWNEQTNYKKYDIKSIYFTDEYTGFVTGGNQENERAFIYKTSNSGVNWFEVYDSLSFGVINSVHFSNSLKGLCVGNNGNILRTFNAGDNWYSENIYSGNLFSVSFFDMNNGLISGSDGLIFKSTDGGNYWFYILSGQYVNLYCVNYFDIGNAVASGENGTVLYSVNGGYSWNKEIRITSNDLYSIELNKSDKIFAAGDFGTLINSYFNNPKLNTSSDNIQMGNEINLIRNYPNPFNPSTEIIFNVKKENDFIKILIFDIKGSEVASLVNKKLGAGLYKEKFETGSFGYELSSGIYFYKLVVNGKTSGTGRMIYMK